MFETDCEIYVNVINGKPQVTFTGMFNYGELRSLFKLIEKEYMNYTKEIKYGQGRAAVK